MKTTTKKRQSKSENVKKELNKTTTENKRFLSGQHCTIVALSKGQTVMATYENARSCLCQCECNRRDRTKIEDEDEDRQEEEEDKTRKKVLVSCERFETKVQSVKIAKNVQIS